MTPEGALREAAAGKLRPVYLLVGEETFLTAEVVAALRGAADMGAAAGFNTDRFVAGDTGADRVVSAAQTAPMMARQRFILLSGVDRWDKKGDNELDALATYAADPAPFTVLVVTAPKLNAARKIMKAAKKDDFLVSCLPLGRRDLPGWIRRKAQAMGHPIDPAQIEALAELSGPELANVADALERLSLYVGPNQPIDEAAVVAVVTRLRLETTWSLVDALADGNLGAALAALRDAFDVRDNGLPLLGAIAWRTRQLAKFKAALGAGRSATDAAQASGVAPFKARDVERTVKRLDSRAIESWLLLLAEADLALKGSRRSGSEVIAAMLVDMCAAR
jgi:DNA polymerase III subunit delta